VWDPASGKEIRRIDTGYGYRASSDYALVADDFSTVCVPRDGRKVERMTDDPKKRHRIMYDGEVAIWDLATGKDTPRSCYTEQPVIQRRNLKGD
jgi:hypothetical protein